MELSDTRLADPMLAESRLTDTRRAFDSVAATYDGPRGNNALIQRMRDLVWQQMAHRFPAGGHMLDLGCGTGHDAIHLAQAGCTVTATDWSPAMLERTRERSAEHGVAASVNARLVGAHDLQPLIADNLRFDGIYSNFGALNCVPDLAQMAAQCAQLLRPGGTMIFTVIGRICPWELAHYGLVKRNLKRARVRFEAGITPVNLNKHTIWTRYYWPREFYRPFAPYVALTHYRALSLFVPPPYLTGLYDSARPVFEALAQLDERLGGWPLLRDMGDHFLIILTKKADSR